MSTANGTWILQDDFTWKLLEPAEPDQPAEPAWSAETSKPFPLSTDSEARKGMPIWSGVFEYFPNALSEVARVSKLGNDKHNPGEPLHWARGKSMDQRDCVQRHELDYFLEGHRDKDGMHHLAYAAWRALADLQLALEREHAGLKR